MTNTKRVHDKSKIGSFVERILLPQLSVLALIRETWKNRVNSIFSTPRSANSNFQKNGWIFTTRKIRRYCFMESIQKRKSTLSVLKQF